MEPNHEQVNLVVSHQDQIVELPPQAEVLMSSDFCPYSMIKVGTCLLGLQGHPEFSRDYSLALMNRRRHRIPAPVIDNGANSLSRDVNDLAVMRWLVAFLKQV
jgi:GMP synthase-like glutamine amidotransferase